MYQSARAEGRYLGFIPRSPFPVQAAWPFFFRAVPVFGEAVPLFEEAVVSWAGFAFGAKIFYGVLQFVNLGPRK